VAQAQNTQTPTSAAFSLSAAGQSSAVINLAGCSSAAVVVDNSGTGQTLVPQASSDPNSIVTPASAQWGTVTTIGAGSITTFGQFNGPTASVGIFGFRVVLTALSSGGPVTGHIGCSNAVTSMANGATGNVQGVGTAGSPSGGVVSVQGVAGGTAVPVSGTLTTTPSGTQNVAVTSPVAASGAVQTANCDPTTASRCATVTAGGALTVTGSVTSTTAFPYNTGNTGQAAQNTAALQGACQFNTSPVTLTTGQVIGTTCDALGNALANISAGFGTATANPLFVVPGSAGFTVTTTLPYTYTATQSPKTGSFVGVAGYDGTNIQPWNVNANGVGRATLYNITGTLGVAVSGGVSAGLASGNALEVGSFNLASNGSTFDPFRKDTYAAGPIWVTTGGSTTVSVPSNATTVVKASAGRLARILITTLGAGTLICYDNATTGSGTIIGSYGASAAVGTVEQLDMPAANGITCVSSSTGPVATVSFY